MLRKICSLCVVLVVGSFLGCGGDDGPELGQVTGTVTLDGQPLPGGTISFIPDNSAGTTGPLSDSEIGPDGTYVLNGAGGRQGAVIGKHVVTVIGPPDLSNTSRDPNDPEPAPGPPVKVSGKYADSTTSGLTAEVKAGENTIPIALVSE